MALGEVIGMLVLAGAIIAGLKNMIWEQRQSDRLNLK